MRLVPALFHAALVVLLFSVTPGARAEEGAVPEEGALIGVGVGNPFLVCMTLLPDRDICTERLGRNAWRPEKPRDPKGKESCEYYSYVIEDRLKFGDLSPWEDLFYNERCRTLGLPHFDGLASSKFVQREYIDPEGRFSVQYPPDWEILPYEIDNAAIIIGHRSDPLGGCTIGINEVVETRGKTPKQMVREMWLGGKFEAELRDQVTDLKFTWRSETLLSGLRAFEAIWESNYYSTEYGDLMNEFGQRMRMYSIMTWQEGFEYRLWCTTENNFFDDFLTNFKLFAASFLIRS